MPTTLDTIALALITYAIHSAAACALALIIGPFLRRPQDRDVVWKAALVAPIVTAAFAALFAAFGNGGGFVDLAALARRVSMLPLPGREVTVRIVQDDSGTAMIRRMTDPVASVISIGATVIASLCILVASARVIARRVARGRLLSARERSLEPLITPRGETVRVSVADELPSPVAIGMREICLPTEVVHDFSPAQRDALVAHEIAHLERRDPIWLFVAEAIAALTAFQPLVWMVIGAFRRDVELICDETAVRRTRDAASLIGALARLASPFDAHSPMHGAATAHDGSPLVARAERIAALELGTRVSGAGVPALVAAATLTAALFAVPAMSSAARWRDIPLVPFADAEHARVEGRLVRMEVRVRTLVVRIQ